MDSYTTNADEATRIDSGLKNKFRFEWLNCKDEHGDILSSSMRKPRQHGLVFCTCCKSLLSYSSNCKRALISHSLSKKHIKFRSTVKSNQTLPASYQVWQGATVPITPAPAKVSSLDRTTHLEATSIMLLVENGFSLSSMPSIVDYWR